MNINRRKFLKNSGLFLPSAYIKAQTFSERDIAWMASHGAQSSNNGLLNGLVSVWEMEQQTGFDQIDSVALLHPMHHTGTPVQSSTHIEGAHSAMGTGNSSYYTNTDAVFVNTSSFTLYSWVNDNNGGLSSVFPADRWNTDHAWAVTQTGSSLELAIRNAADSGNFLAASSVTVTGVAWHMFVVTYNSATKTGQFSIDGENFISTGVTDGMRTTVDGLRLANCSAFTDETAYWSVVLTQSQVTTLYNAGSGFFFSGGMWTT